MEQTWKLGTTVYTRDDEDQDTPGKIITPPHAPDPDDLPSVYVRWGRNHARWEYVEDLVSVG